MKVMYIRPTRICSALFTFTILGLSVHSLMAAAGQLDPTFGKGGKVLTPFPTGGFAGAGAKAAALQSDGKIVVAGMQTDSQGNPSSILVRYNTNGSLDSSFGKGGIVVGSTSAGTGFLGVAIQNDGKIVANSFKLERGLIIARYNRNGTSDTTFGTAGVVTTELLGRLIFAGQPGTIAIQSDGKIVVGCVGLLRLNPNGSIDTSYGNEGAVITVEQPVNLVIQKDNRVVLAGGPVSRYNTDGTLDTTFGVLGTTNSVSGAGGVALQSNGSMVGAGSFFNVPSPAGPQVNELIALRFDANGQLDSTFGSGGGAIAPPPSGSLTAGAAVAVQSNGDIVVAGSTGVNSPGGGTTNPLFELARFTTAGQLDPTFGTNGQVTTKFGDNDSAIAVLIQADGKIIAVGNSFKLSTGVNGTDRIALARYLAQ